MLPILVNNELKLLLIDIRPKDDSQQSLFRLVFLFQNDVAQSLHLTKIIQLRYLPNTILTSLSSFTIYASFFSLSLASIFSSLYIQTSPSKWYGCSTSISLDKLNTSATDCGPCGASTFPPAFSPFSPFFSVCFDLDIFKFWNTPGHLYLYRDMSADLLKKIEAARNNALQNGSVVKLRRQDVDRTKLLGAKFTYSWYQTPAKVGIEIPHVVEKKEGLKIKFEEDRVTIDFPIKNNQEIYHLDLILFKGIIPARSKAHHRLDSIEIVMEKAKQSENWSFLRRDGIGIPEGAPKQEILYPSSSKVKKNWDKIDKEIEGDILKHGEEYGEDTSMSFFKQIFAQGDEEKRRAMMKSFQTSGGTVLSTDWTDVKKKDYEGRDRPSPPKGQEWRKREL